MTGSHEHASDLPSWRPRNAVPRSAFLTAWIGRQSAHQAGLSYWDVAGALTFIGICVAATIEPDRLVELIWSGTHQVGCEFVSQQACAQGTLSTVLALLR